LVFADWFDLRSPSGMTVDPGLGLAPVADDAVFEFWLATVVSLELGLWLLLSTHRPTAPKTIVSKRTPITPTTTAMIGRPEVLGAAVTDAPDKFRGGVAGAAGAGVAAALGRELVGTSGGVVEAAFTEPVVGLGDGGRVSAAEGITNVGGGASDEGMINVGGGGAGVTTVACCEGEGFRGVPSSRQKAKSSA
jgi:hypothetical protein